MNKYICFLIIIITTLSCSKEEIKTYSGDNFIRFSKSNTDSLLYSFAFNPNVETANIDIEVEVSSLPVNVDRTYSIKFNAEESNAIIGEELISFSGEQILKANSFKDTITIQIKKTARMKDEAVIAIFELENTEAFKPLFPNNNKIKIVAVDKISRPEWWDDNFHVRSGLGKYSEKKFRLFIQVTGINNLDYENNEDMTYSEMRNYVLQFKHWLHDNPQTEDDGTEMVVPMVG